jgi:hypothetical protein
MRRNEWRSGVPLLQALARPHEESKQALKEQLKEET